MTSADDDLFCMMGDRRHRVVKTGIIFLKNDLCIFAVVGHCLFWVHNGADLFFVCHDLCAEGLIQALVISNMIDVKMGLQNCAYTDAHRFKETDKGFAFLQSRVDQDDLLMI